jgi:hypothetical protein
MSEKYGDREFNILNIRTGEKINIKYETETIDEIMEVLFENKFGLKPKITNEEFLEKCNTIYNNVQNNVNELVDITSSEDSISMFVKPKKTQQTLIKSSKPQKIIEDNSDTETNNDVDVNDITRYLTGETTINVKKVKAIEKPEPSMFPKKKVQPVEEKEPKKKVKVTVKKTT